MLNFLRRIFKREIILPTGEGKTPYFLTDADWRHWYREQRARVQTLPVLSEIPRVLPTLIIKSVQGMGKGLFLAENTTPLPETTILGSYVGITAPYLSETGMPLSAVWNQLDWSFHVDAEHYYNALRYVNHARKKFPGNISFLATANVVLQIALFQRKPIILYVAKREIKPGEQLLIDYGWQFWQGRNAELILTTINSTLPNTQQLEEYINAEIAVFNENNKLISEKLCYLEAAFFALIAQSSGLVRGEWMVRRDKIMGELRRQS